MAEDELLDLVNDKDEVIGTVYRSAAHKNPALIHREIAVGLFNSKGQTLIQQRSKYKSSPLSWRITAAGHIQAGKDPQKEAEREIEEELGIKIKLEYFDKIFDQENQESKFYWLYTGMYEGNNFNLDTNEVNAVKWVSIDEISPGEGKISVGEISYDVVLKMHKKLFNGHFDRKA